MRNSKHGKIVENFFLGTLCKLEVRNYNARKHQQKYLAKLKINLYPLDKLDEGNNVFNTKVD